MVWVNWLYHSINDYQFHEFHCWFMTYILCVFGKSIRMIMIKLCMFSYRVIYIILGRTK